MTVTDETTAADRAEAWLLLLYFLPASRAHARVQAWRRLQRVGAVSLKNSAYVLPHSPEAREDFEWIKSEIASAGGQAVVLLAQALDPDARREIVDLFQRARGDDFAALAADLSKAVARASRTASRPQRAHVQRVRRLRERFEETARIDFFGAPGRDRAAALVARLDPHTRKASPMTRTASAPLDRRTAPHHGVWLTRPRPGIDRLSSAWLIRRFVDPHGTFVFGDPATRPDAIPFDTFDADLGHHGSHCTFETICERFGIADDAVGRIAHIVHDLDLKVERYREPDTATIGRLVEGLRRAHADDTALLDAGIGLFEALYQSATASGAADTPRTPARPPRASRAPASERGTRRSRSRGRS